MAATTGGSKKGKKKGKTLNLGAFLSDGGSNTGDGKAVVTLRSSNWADTMDEEDELGPSASQQITLPTAPRAAREEIDLSTIPDTPPFTAHVGNLSYDADEESLLKFFSAMTVSEVRLVSEMGRSKGYGYVEFADKQSLIEALGLNGEMLFSRKVKVDLATNSSSSSSRYGTGEYRRGNPPTGESDADNDWRASAAQNRANLDSGFGRRGGYEDGGYGRRGYDDRDGGYGRRGYDDRDGGYGRRGYGDRDSYDSRGDSEETWSRGASRGSDSDGRRGYDDRESGYRRDGPSRYDDQRGYNRQGSSDPPKERPRLQLAPRSKPAENGSAKEGAASTSIFGGAKPVDTASRERQIDERLQHTQDSRPANSGSSFSSRDIRTNVERRVYNAVEEKSHTEPRSQPKPAASEPAKKPSAASIFGSAKPVDTAAREREIEERLSKREQAAEGSAHQNEESRDPPPPKNSWNRGPPAGTQPSGPRDAAHVGSRQQREKREKKVPQHIDEMPVYEESKSKDFSDGNKFAGLVDGSDGEEHGNED